MSPFKSLKSEKECRSATTQQPSEALVQFSRLLMGAAYIDNAYLCSQKVFPTRTRPSYARPQPRCTPSEIPPGTFVDIEAVPVLVDAEADYHFDEDWSTGSNRSEIGSQLPATTFWGFAREYISKLPALFMRGPRGEGR